MSFDPVNFTKENIKPATEPSAADMQNKMMEIQKKLLSLEIEGKAGVDNYSVKVYMNGRHEATRVIIDQELLAQGVEVLNGLIAAAITDAAHKAEVAIQQEFLGAMQGMKLPGQ